MLASPPFCPTLYLARGWNDHPVMCQSRSLREREVCVVEQVRAASMLATEVPPGRRSSIAVAYLADATNWTSSVGDMFLRRALRIQLRMFHFGILLPDLGARPAQLTRDSSVKAGSVEWTLNFISRPFSGYHCMGNERLPDSWKSDHSGSGPRNVLTGSYIHLDAQDCTTRHTG